MVHDWKSHHLPEGKSNLQWMRLSIRKDYQKFAFMFERVIGLLKNKCTILQGTFQIRSLKNEDMVDATYIDEIATVCAALTNLCTSVVESV